MLLRCHFVLAVAIRLASAILLTDICKDDKNEIFEASLVRQGKIINWYYDVIGRDHNVFTVQHPGSVIFLHNPKVANMTYELGMEPYLSHGLEQVDLGKYTEPAPKEMDDAFDPRTVQIELPFEPRTCHSSIDWPVQDWLRRQSIMYDTESTPEKQWTAFGYGPIGADVGPQKISSQDFIGGVLDSKLVSTLEATERDGVFFSMVEANGLLAEDKVRNLTKALSAKMSVPRSAACARIYAYNNKLGYTFAYGLSKEDVKKLDCARFEARKVYYTWSAPMEVIGERMRSWKRKIKIYKVTTVMLTCSAVILIYWKKRRQNRAWHTEILPPTEGTKFSDSKLE